MKSEVEHAIVNALTRRALGLDETPTELLKLIDENNMKIVVKLFNGVYNTEIIPSDWSKPTYVAIPRKHRAGRRSEYWLISLMRNTLRENQRQMRGRSERDPIWLHKCARN
ncbi:hypothetical protein JTB14_024245 [Gonioctena quinquepunctata]|nr:hypothetical protein JTB14_024245 [Gonioctena quinquepunctata]